MTRQSIYRPILCTTRRWAHLLLLALLILPLSGCFATISELRKERRLREALEEQFRSFKREQRKKEEDREKRLKAAEARLRGLVAQISVKIARFGKEIDSLKKTVKRGQGGVAEMFTTLQTLQTNFQKSLGQLDELQKQIKDVMQRSPDQNKQYQDLLKRYEELLRNQKKLAEQAIPAKLFAKARDDFKAKRNDRGLKTFRIFVQRFGSHPLADNALLYIGDILRMKGQSSSAIQAFDDILKKYPNESSVPVALFRLGQIHYGQGLCRQGRRYFLRLTRYRRHARQLAGEAKRLYRNWRSLCKRKRRRR